MSQYSFVYWVSKSGTALGTEYNNFLHNELSVYPGCNKSPYTDIQNPELNMCQNTILVYNRRLWFRSNFTKIVCTFTLRIKKLHIMFWLNDSPQK